MSFCCGPELLAAKILGVEMEVQMGLIIPTKKVIKPYLDYITYCVESRKQVREGFSLQQSVEGVGKFDVWEASSGVDEENWLQHRYSRSMSSCHHRESPIHSSLLTPLHSVEEHWQRFVNSLPSSVTVCQLYH